MILQEDQIDLSTPTGAMRTYVHRPVARGRYPGVVRFSEICQRKLGEGDLPEETSPHAGETRH